MLKMRRKIQKRASSIPGRFLYFIHLPPAWAENYFPGEVELIFQGESVIIKPLNVEGGGTEK